MRCPARNVWATSGSAKTMWSGLPGSKGTGFSKLLRYFAAERFAADQLLVSAHAAKEWQSWIPVVGRRWGRRRIVVRRIVGIDVDHFDVEIGIGA